MIKYRVTGGQKLRLDHFLLGQGIRRSRAQIQKKILKGGISIQRSLEVSSYSPVSPWIKASTFLLPGDEVEISLEERVEPLVSLNYQVLYEDDSLLVVNKPANLPVHPAGRYYRNTLLKNLQDRFPNQKFFLVHRIDRETSGVILLTKNSQSCAFLVKEFAERRVQKRYLALVSGAFPNEKVCVDLPLGPSKNAEIALKMYPQEPLEGFSATTFFERIRVFTQGTKSLSYLACFPKTGRQHQIRAHLSALGYPILGDKLYSLPESEALLFFHPRREEVLSSSILEKLKISSHALHASSLEFVHPETQRLIHFEAPLPQEWFDDWIPKFFSGNFSGQRESFFDTVASGR